MLSQDVCPFVTRRCYVETAKFIIKLFFPSGIFRYFFTKLYSNIPTGIT